MLANLTAGGEASTLGAIRMNREQARSYRCNRAPVNGYTKCAELEIALQQKIGLDSGEFWFYEPEVARALFTIESEQLPWAPQPAAAIS